MNHEYVLMQYYVRYLKEVRKLSDSSVGHYTQALKKISKMLVERNRIQETVYEIKDLNELQIVKEYIFQDNNELYAGLCIIIEVLRKKRNIM